MFGGGERCCTSIAGNREMAMLHRRCMYIRMYTFKFTNRVRKVYRVVFYIHDIGGILKPNGKWWILSIENGYSYKDISQSKSISDLCQTSNEHVKGSRPTNDLRVDIAQVVLLDVVTALLCPLSLCHE